MSVFDGVSSGSCFGLCNDGSAPTHPTRPFHGREFSQQEEGLEAEDRQQKKELDALLSQAMENLTLEERLKQQDIVHGTDDTVEDSTMVNIALQDLDMELRSIKHNSMYEVAERINPAYVHAKSFQVMFLRANEYDAKASADQMLRFFESKYQLFGIEKLVEDITLADLSEEDISRLKMGWIQLAGKDRSGRQVIVHFGGEPGNLESWLRVQYFVKMKALEDEETQLRGIVTIWCATGDQKSSIPDGKAPVEIIKAGKALPQKRSAIHICTDEVRQYVMFNVMVKLFQSRLRMRLRVHFGSPMECQYQLSTFGIHPQSLPLHSSGRIDLDSHLNWVESCTMGDTRSMDVVASPTRNDVLFTGGKRINHLGNQVFQTLVQNHSYAYDHERDTEKKRQIVATIIEKIHESGGRFLHQRQTDVGPAAAWKKVPADELRKKIMQTFRNRRNRAEASKRKAEESLTGQLIAGEPLPSDVVFGRMQRNPGTELLHGLIKEHFEEYESLGRGEKMGLVETIMQTIKDGGGRFLLAAAENGDRWRELSNRDVRERISKYFRNSRRPLKGK